MSGTSLIETRLPPVPGRKLETASPLTLQTIENRLPPWPVRASSSSGGPSPTPARINVVVVSKCTSCNVVWERYPARSEFAADVRVAMPARLDLAMYEIDLPHAADICSCRSFFAPGTCVPSLCDFIDIYSRILTAQGSNNGVSYASSKHQRSVHIESHNSDF